jgi:Uma2 family endonuclease
MSVKQLMTAEQLWEMPEAPGRRYELVKGELVEVPGAGGLHGAIALLIGSLLSAFVRPRRLGIVGGDGTGYILARDPDELRIPDVSFVSRARIPEGGVPRGCWPLAPDLAVEIVPPGNAATEIRRKVREYLDAGTRLVWVVWPDDRAVTVHAADGAARDLGAEDELDGGDVLPGFRVRVAELFEID